MKYQYYLIVVPIHDDWYNIKLIYFPYMCTLLFFQVVSATATIHGGLSRGLLGLKYAK